MSTQRQLWKHWSLTIRALRFEETSPLLLFSCGHWSACSVPKKGFFKGTRPCCKTQPCKTHFSNEWPSGWNVHRGKCLLERFTKIHVETVVSSTFHILRYQSVQLQPVYHRRWYKSAVIFCRTRASRPHRHLALSSTIGIEWQFLGLDDAPTRVSWAQSIFEHLSSSVPPSRAVITTSGS